MGNEIVVTCENGHTLVLGNLDEAIDHDPVVDKQVRATIFPCQVEMAKPEHGNLIFECGARIVWKHFMTKPDKVKKVVFTKNGVDRGLTF